MDELDLEACRPIESHARLVMQWRNDPKTLQMSYHQQPETWSEFWPKFQSQFDPSVTRHHYFAVYRGHRAAYLRLDSCVDPRHPGHTCYEVSINVAPEFRSKGIGPAALTFLAKQTAAAGGDSLYAEVRQQNFESLACFRKAGFRNLERLSKHVADTGEDAPIQTMILDLEPLRKGKTD